MVFYGYKGWIWRNSPGREMTDAYVGTEKASHISFVNKEWMPVTQAWPGGKEAGWISGN